MLERGHPVVEFKLGLLDRSMPARDAIVFGDVWGVDGGYTVACVERDCERALLIDGLESAVLQEQRLRRPEIDFMKGDFSNPLFMSSFDLRFDLGVAFDVLLHQPGLLATLSLMLEKLHGRFCIAQPMLEEQDRPGAVYYLPGNGAVEDLYPLDAQSEKFKVFDVTEVNHSNWIWAMTPSFLKAALEGEGFTLMEEEVLSPLPNPRWHWWGGIFERTRPKADGHWTRHGVTPGLWAEGW